MSLADCLRNIRKTRGLSQKQLAARIKAAGNDGPSEGMIAQVETGRRALSITMVENICDALGLGEDESADLHEARVMSRQDLQTVSADRVHALEERLSSVENDRLAGLRAVLRHASDEQIEAVELYAFQLIAGRPGRPGDTGPR